MTPGTWRCFVGVPVPGPLRDELRAAVRRLKLVASEDEGRLRWVDPTSWHLTLAFLGGVATTDIPVMVAHLERVASEHATFSIPIGALGGFPSRRNVRILWLGLADRTHRLAELAGAVRQAVGQGAASPFRPHLTLARAQGDKEVVLGPATWATRLSPRPLAVDRLVLYRSHLASDGSSYEALATALLGSVPAGSRGAA